MEHRVARVAADPVLTAGGERPGGWTGLRYHRLHGSPRIYYSPYGPERLAALAQTLTNGKGTGRKTWCIFDNTAAGAATSNALSFQTLLAPPVR